MFADARCQFLNNFALKRFNEIAALILAVKLPAYFSACVIIAVCSELPLVERPQHGASLPLRRWRLSGRRRCCEEQERKRSKGSRQ